MLGSNDWRLQGQEAYLRGEILFYKRYADRKTKADHDHCEFCWDKFSDTIADTLKVGYTTADNYRWICAKCFEDFKQKLQFTIGNKNQD